MILDRGEKYSGQLMSENQCKILNEIEKTDSDLFFITCYTMPKKIHKG